MLHTSPGVAPGRPCRLKSRFEIDGPRLTVSYHGIDPSGFFLLLWLIGWTASCIWLTGSALREPTAALLAILFWAAWVFIDRRNVESLSIGDLTEGEARWMADVVLRHCHWWGR
ncbi:MAG: hypothetical protein GXX96_02115 [Planctomycetaceae bacterium]|nr:hypothetical protein [Planctomycetaceae bacterium]